MPTKLIVFLEVLAVVGAVAFFSGQHEEHLAVIAGKLETLERHMEASEKALQLLQDRREEVANARLELDRKMEDACNFDGVLRYDYYDRLLREDAERRAGHGVKAAGGVDDAVH